ncbi:MAG: hydrogenase maturation protease [Sandaracinaceae bacterium]|nr:hydrogenase maturation protease [Sandaracinaceae bacterium]
MSVRVIALGSAMSRDDGAALAAARALEGEPGATIVLAGRPGPGLLDLLAPGAPVVLLDAVRGGAAPGEIVELSLDALARAAVANDAVSSHGLGVASALRLGIALGRALPPGRFVGIGGARFEPGEALSPEVAAALPRMIEAARAAVAALREAAQANRGLGPERA